MRVTMAGGLIGVLLALPAFATETGFSLTEARTRAYTLDPELTRLQGMQPAFAARAQQSGRLANPELNVTLDNLGQAHVAEGPTTEVGISQALPLGNKLSSRTALARAEERSNLLGIAQRKAELAAEVRLCLAQWTVARERLSLAREEAEVAKAQAVAVAEKLRAGRVVESEQARAQALAREAELVAVSRERESRVARRRCELVMGELPEVPPELPLPTGADKPVALSQRQAELARQQAAAAAKVARAESMPDLTVSVGARRYQDSGEQALVVGAALPLPLFDRNRPARLESQAQLAAAQQSATLAATRAEARLLEAEAELQSASEALTQLEAEVLPATRESLRVAEVAYRAGKTGLLEWLDARRVWRDARERWLTTWLAVQEAVAALERETGLPD